MKHAISNIALTAYRHADELSRLAALGLDGIEVAPSRVWENTWDGLDAVQVSTYRRQVESAGLEVVGLHSLLFDHPELELFGDRDHRDRLLEFFVHLSAVCRDLGGRTLIWGGGRRRGKVPMEEAIDRAIDFFTVLADRIDGHGTCFCIEPLGHNDTDFIHSVLESKRIVEAVGRPGLKVQIDAKALVAGEELALETFRAVAGDLVHYHANEPGFGVLGSSGKIDHHAAGKFLMEIGYVGYASIEQKMIGEENPLGAIGKSVSLLKEAYG